ncbi:hypothetical protein Rcae01_04858 [Novipirellula caenicola]|uniref:Uncharacterized protein n=1 Tax=Novipirellula caenicola TaxID=1536901 RepID=A0ABP9VW40_9BACT
MRHNALASHFESTTGIAADQGCAVNDARFVKSEQQRFVIVRDQFGRVTQRVVWPTPPLIEAKGADQRDDYTTKACSERRRKAFAAWMPQLCGHTLLADTDSSLRVRILKVDVSRGFEFTIARDSVTGFVAQVVILLDAVQGRRAIDGKE